MTTLASAILSLKPLAEFVITENDYSTIIWHKLEGDAPTLAEIELEMKRLTNLELSAESNKAIAKQSAIAKLAALGLTEDEAKAITG
jgi:hypothetical protein